MPDELFDIIDEEDIVIGQEMRSIVHQQGLWHRGVHVLLFTREGKLLVQQRSKDRVHSPFSFGLFSLRTCEGWRRLLRCCNSRTKGRNGCNRVDINRLIKFKMNYGPNDNEISELYKGVVDPAVVSLTPLKSNGLIITV